MQVSFSCDRGDIRTTNEDRVMVKKYAIFNEEWGLFLVADGMSGRGGEASQTIVDVLTGWCDNDLATLLSLPFDMDLVVSSLDSAIAVANSNIRALQTGEPIVSTLSLVLVMGKKYIIRHVGNSRIYLVDGQIRRLTTDHIADAGLTSKRPVLTMCMGANNAISLFEAEGERKPGDMFVICSDGLYDLVADDIILATVTNPSTPMIEKAQALRACIPQGKAHDNVSIILAGDVQDEQA